MTNFEKCCRGVVKDLDLLKKSYNDEGTVTMGLYSFSKGVFSRDNPLASRPCSMFLRRNKAILNGNYACVILIGKSYKKKYNKLYYNWLFNESPFKDCYYTKYVDKTKNNAVFVNFKQPFQLVYAATIMLRVWEYEGHAKSFDALVKGGVSPEFAALLKWYVTVNTTGNLSFSRRPLSNNHTFPDPEGVLANEERLKLWLINKYLIDHSKERSQDAMFPSVGLKVYFSGDKLQSMLKSMGKTKKTVDGRFSWFIAKNADNIPTTLSSKELCNRLNKIEQEILS